MTRAIATGGQVLGQERGLKGTKPWIYRGDPARSGGYANFQGRLRAYLEKANSIRVIADATEAIKLDPQRVGFVTAEMRGTKQEYD